MRRLDPLSLLAGAVIMALGIFLVLDQAGAIDLDFGWLGVLLTASAGAILLASGHLDRRGPSG